MGQKEKSNLVNNPLVSVILPTWNRAHLLPRAINSVLSQTYQNLELIIVDDVSTDNTAETVAQITDKRIKYTKLNYKKTDTSYGATKARNVGLDTARGELIAFQDSDDQWLPEKLQKQVTTLTKAPAKTGVVFTTLRRKENGVENLIPPHNFKLPPDNQYTSVLRKTNTVSLVTAIVKKECFKNVGVFDEKMPKYQEWELWIRIAKHYGFLYIDEPLVVSYAQKGSVSTNPASKIVALERLLKKHYAFFEQDPHSLATHYFELGKSYCGLAGSDFRKGRQYLISATKLQPFSIKILFLLALSLTGPCIYRALKAFKS